jgi:hypothetical protein
MWTILKRLFVWVFPVLLFEGCLNRDPYLKIDEQFSMAAISGSHPLTLINRDPNARQARDAIKHLNEDEFIKASEEMLKTSRWQLHEITDYKISEKAIIGCSPEGFLIADRRSGKLRLFQTVAERDKILRGEFHLDAVLDFMPPSEWMWARSRTFWPWFHLYFLACFILIPWLSLRAERNAKSQFYELPND